jgi:hypothetical protein
MNTKQRWKFDRWDRATLGLSLVMVLAVTGCVGYVDGGYVGGAVVAPDPDLVVFGGGPGHFDRGYSHRGFVSRGAVHGGHR